MSKNIGSQLLALTCDQRRALMRGLVFRRLAEGVALTRVQLEVGIQHDFDEIKKKFAAWDPAEFISQPMPEFFQQMLEERLISQKTQEGIPYPVVRQTKVGKVFLEALDEDLKWLIEITPMSTRGMFDNLVANPEEIEVEAEEGDTLGDVLDIDPGENKQVIVTDPHKVEDDDDA